MIQQSDRLNDSQLSSPKMPSNSSLRSQATMGVLNEFVIDMAHKETNMITHPYLIDSFRRETKINQEKFMEAPIPIVQFEHLRVLMAEVGRRCRQPDHPDRFREVIQQNQMLKRENNRLRQQLHRAIKDLEDKKNLLTKKGYFQLKVQFYQEAEEIVRKIEQAQLQANKSMNLLADRLVKCQKSLASINISIDRRHQRFRLTNSVESLSRIHNRSRSRGRIFPESPVKKLRQEPPKVQSFILVDEVGTTFTKDQVKILSQSIVNLQNKLQRMTKVLRQTQKSITQSKQVIPVKLQAAVAQTKIAEYDAGEFISILSRIQVMKSDFKDLDRDAEAVMENLRKFRTTDS